MLAAQVPVCELFPAAPQSVELSWGKHSIVQLSDIVQLSTGACWEQGVTLGVLCLGVSHTVGSARALGACACQLRSKEPYPQIQILLPALSLLWEVRTVFACYPSENLCSDFSVFFIYCCHWRLHCLKSGPQVWRWATCLYFSVNCRMVLGWGASATLVGQSGPPVPKDTMWPTQFFLYGR